MKQRILTAVIGIIVVAPIIVYGNWPFMILAYLLATIALFEMIRMYKPSIHFIYFFISLLFLWFILVPTTEISIYGYTMSKLNLLLVLAILLLVMMVFSKNKFNFDQASFVFFATVYVGMSFYFVIDTRMMGLALFLFILFIIWATDSGAYFIGKFLGKRKLWPSISPNKTIGGAVGGIIFALIVAGIFQLVYPFEHSFIMILILAAAISIIGQIGDLVASAMKRHYDIKDFGNIFPGHGGILDRFDSLLFVTFVLHVVQLI